MDSLTPPHIWIMRLWFVALALLILFFHLLPLQTMPRRWAPPDLLIAFTFAWSVRRPDFVPAFSVAAVMLLADLMLQRPPGLLAMLVVLGSEHLKSRFAGAGETGFMGEWISVSLVILIVAILHRLILTVTLVDQAQLSLSLIQMMMTMAAYPAVALLTQSVMGVRRLSPNTAETMGSRG
ncbi:rod shape-determining protein MreD [Sedimentitalea sp. JM2-8]|uniref:Rod shape-determining protein MreD n=1 Tax=Sedimentitalea xiamensis TaxID=3050037 RepID=A0ABT7FAQ1_9RHOB|nr:rod shape-determining protein MreD [Sedimentitalea xiamensis]MDK3072188.1 rod shape-determining protein MreD [Sedimentitalea xiamensis]